MTLGLFPEETTNALDALGRMPHAGAPQPAWYAGTLTAVPRGVASGVVGTEETAETGFTSVLSDTLFKPFTDAAQRYGAMGGVVPPAASALEPEQYKINQARSATEAVQAFAPDPRTTGFAGQTLYGLSKGVTQFVGGAAVAGPVGGAAVVGASTGTEERNDLIARGVDRQTADTIGVGAGLFAGGASLLPGGYGRSLLSRILTGSAAQAEFGIYNRGLTHNVLEDAGYTAQAQQYKALDGMSIMADATLGAAFGGVHHYFAPSEIDAALTTRSAVHREIDTAPGIPATPDARALHVEQLTQAARQLMNDEPVTGMQMPETIPNPAQDALHEATTTALHEASAEATEPVVGAQEAPRNVLPAEYHPGGPTGMVKTNPIAANALFRETSLYDLRDLLGHDQVGGALRTFLTDDKDLAIGQGGKGVMVEYEPGLVSGAEHQKPGTGIVGGKEFSSDYIAKNAIRSITIKDGAAFDKINADNISSRDSNTKNQLLRRFDLTHNKDGSVTLTRKGAAKTSERRADAVEGARMRELRDTSDRTPEQQAEYVRLLESDRLAAKVGGRRIEGLLSREALEEQIARGEGFSHYAYFDLDMFKAINDEFSMAHGDEAIRATGEAAAAIAGKGRAFKGSERAGDEFVLGGHDPAVLEQQIAAIRQHLKNHAIELYKDGVLVKSRKGLDFSHGVAESGPHGKETEPAAGASKLAKSERAKLGLRAERRAVPEDVPGTVRPGEGEASAGTEAASLDPATREALDQAQEALSRRPELTVEGETGEPVSAKDALENSLADLSAAKAEGVLHQIAAACFGRG